MLIKTISKLLLKIMIEFLKFPFKMMISTYYINTGKVGEAEDIMKE